MLEGPQASTIAEAVRDVGKWLNERPNRPLDLRGVAMLCAYAQAQARAVTLALHQRDSIKANAWRETPLHGYFDADEIIDAVEAAHGITHKEGGQDAD